MNIKYSVRETAVEFLSTIYLGQYMQMWVLGCKSRQIFEHVTS